MSVFFMTIWAVFILLLYVRSILVPMEKVRDNQAELIKTLEKMEADTEVPQSLGSGLMKGLSVVMLIFYALFYITAATIVNQLLFTIVSAAFIVASIYSVVKIFELIKVRELTKIKWYTKLNSFFGLFYTMYFVGFYYHINTTDNQSPFFLGTFIAIIIFILFKINAKKQRDKKAKEETP